ncbi:helix-turn-helix domain-containing protein [Haloparvum sedimenti]|uniref:helix-turn-helix domain-containing protein n=1 Tax=Haloparvum sedimenti TaxID=1678448 RepID=UPI00071E80CB|nr:helix-turn-helix domain-containing protein [Haloparvum sedimenti]
MSSNAGDADGGCLRVDLDVEPGSAWECPIVDDHDDVREVTVNAVGDDCRVDLTPADESGVVTATGSVDEDCLCHVFQRHDCVPRIRGVDAGTMRVTTYVDDRSVVRDLVSALRDAVGRVALARLAVVEGPGATERATVDLSALTDAQREALDLAIRRGYFGDGADHAALAAELDISESALSQRLRAGQARLVAEVFDATAD